MSSEPGRLIAGQVADPVPWKAPDICTEATMERGWPIVATNSTRAWQTAGPDGSCRKCIKNSAV